MKNITVIGAGTMGSGIAHVFAQYGYEVVLNDISAPALEKALASITKNLDRMVEKAKLTGEDKVNTLNRLTLNSDLESAVENAELVI